jgi:hypothetical protein
MRSASPYYREAFGDMGNDVELERLPTLPKSTFVDEFDRIVTDPRVRLADLEAHLAGGERAGRFFDRSSSPLAATADSIAPEESVSALLRKASTPQPIVPSMSIVKVSPAKLITASPLLVLIEKWGDGTSPTVIV